MASEEGRVFVQWVTRSNIAELERRDGGLGFDAPGARYPHQDPMGCCSFETLVHECFPCEPVLRELSRIIHWADFPGESVGREKQAIIGRTFDRISLAGIASAGSPDRAKLEAIGLRTIARGFPLVTRDDQDTVERSAFLYDALYASLQERPER